MKTFMAMLNFWIAGIYYLLYGEQREHNDMLALFWAIMGCIWVYDLVVKHASLQRTHNHTGFALLLFAMLISVVAFYQMFLRVYGHFPANYIGLLAVVGALFLVVHMVLGNILEPRMMGHRLGMSTLVVFLSLLIWGWLLGPVGMLLSVPLTSVCKIWMETTKGGSKLAILLGPGRPKSRLPG